MAYPSQNRYPYGMATIQAVPGMPGAAHVPGMAGVTAVQVPGGVSRVPNGMSSMYQTEKSPGLYQSSNPNYPSLAQQGYLTAQPSSLGQPTYYGSSPHTTYIPVTTAGGQQRYLVSTAYPGGYMSAPSMLSSAAGYPLSMGGGYSLSAQPSSLAQMGGAPSLPPQSQTQYPTYIGSQLTPIQISPSQSPYATTAAGYPLYPASAYASLQMQQAQVQGQIPSAYAGRITPNGPGSGLPLGYPTAFYPAP